MTWCFESLCVSYPSTDATLRVHSNISGLENIHSRNVIRSGTLASQTVVSKITQDLGSASGEGKGALSRRKRDILFPSGVKLCSQETVQQALQNHLDYFHLRGEAVCHPQHLQLTSSGCSGMFGAVILWRTSCFNALGSLDYSNLSAGIVLFHHDTVSYKERWRKHSQSQYV